MFSVTLAAVTSFRTLIPFWIHVSHHIATTLFRLFQYSIPIRIILFYCCYCILYNSITILYISITIVAILFIYKLLLRNQFLDCCTTLITIVNCYCYFWLPCSTYIHIYKLLRGFTVLNIKLLWIVSGSSCLFASCFHYHVNICLSSAVRFLI